MRILHHNGNPYAGKMVLNIKTDPWQQTLMHYLDVFSVVKYLMMLG